MSENLDVSEEIARRLAEHSIETLKSTYSFAIQQHADSFKWITASLLAINSGGAFAVLNFEKLDLVSKKVSGLFFLVGILLSMLVAVAAQKLTIRALPILNHQIGFWISVLEDGKIPANLEEIESANAKKVIRFQWIVPMIGWLSAACFVAGMASIGLNLHSEKSPSSAGRNAVHHVPASGIQSNDR